MSELGAYLQRHRDERGLSLDDVETLTRIRRTYLEAMEAGDWEALPPGAYTRGFLRNYARALGVSRASVMRMYAKERPTEARLPEPQLISQPLINEPRITMELVLASVIMVVALVMLLWVVQSYLLPAVRIAGLDGTPAATPATATGAPTRPTSEPRATTRALATSTPPGQLVVVPLESGTPGTPGTAGPTAPPAGASGTSSPPASATPGATQAASATPRGGPATAAPPATGTARGGTPAPDVGGILVEVRATGNAWLRIFTDGEEAYEGFLRDGDAWKGQARGRVRIRMGNAGDTVITLNGRTLDLLGGRGDVLEREWRLLPDGNIEQVDQPG